LHLIPGILYLLLSAVIVITDKLVLKRYYFLASGSDPDFDEVYQYLGVISMFVYFIITLRYFSLYQKLMVQVISYADVLLFKWIRNFLYAFLIMLLVNVFFKIMDNFDFFQKLRYMGPWWQFFSFAIIFYYIGITGYSNSIETKVPFHLNLLDSRSSLLLPYSHTSNSTVEDVEFVTIETELKFDNKKEEPMLQEWKNKILDYMQKDKAYENAELSLTHIAKALNTNASIISKAINQGFQLNFNDFVNNYRIEAVKEKLKAGEQKTQTLLGIAYDCGFNSKATFNRAFKKFTTLSPKEWLESSRLKS
jgi:AraC-like DNA-binding protein